MKYNYTNITIDNRCLDLLLTEDEIATAFARAMDLQNKQYIDSSKCCSCWPTKKPPECGFWRKILGLCVSCECNK